MASLNGYLRERHHPQQYDMISLLISLVMQLHLGDLKSLFLVLYSMQNQQKPQHHLLCQLLQHQYK